MKWNIILGAENSVVDEKNIQRITKQLEQCKNNIKAIKGLFNGDTYITKELFHAEINLITAVGRIRAMRRKEEDEEEKEIKKEIKEKLLKIGLIKV